MPFVEHSDADVRAMLETIGASSMEELFGDIPKDLCRRDPLDLPKPLSEMELVTHLRELADRNVPCGKLKSFLGAGVYNHYIPAVVDALSSRGEFFTAYTPYRLELHQQCLRTQNQFHH